MRIFDANDVKPKVIPRISLGFPEVDWLFGGDKETNVFGPAIQALTIFGGASGVGKTRFWVEVTKMMAQNLQDKVLWIQIEMPLEQFSGVSLKGCNFNRGNLTLSDDRKLSEQIKIIREVKPILVIVDSVNNIDVYNNGIGANAIEQAYRDAISYTNSHVIFITQLNGEGDIKGGTTLPHMVDTVFVADKDDDPAYGLPGIRKLIDMINSMNKDYSVFTKGWEKEFFNLFMTKNWVAIKSVLKNRFGDINRRLIFEHTNTGIEIISDFNRNQPWSPYFNNKWSQYLGQLVNKATENKEQGIISRRTLEEEEIGEKRLDAFAKHQSRMAELNQEAISITGQKIGHGNFFQKMFGIVPPEFRKK